MKNKLKRCVIGVVGAMVLSMPGLTTAFGYEAQKIIRVGLEYQYKNVSSIAVKNQDILLGYEADGEFCEAGAFSSVSGFTCVPKDQYYAVLAQSFKYYNEASDYAASLRQSGYQSVPLLAEAGRWTVGLDSYGTRQEAQNAADACTEDAYALDLAKTVVFSNGEHTLAVFCNGIFPQVKANDGVAVKLADRSYRGAVELGRYAGSGLTAVNVLDLDEYVYSVLPSEMPASYEKEALKAQAVAARTYAISRSRLGTHLADGYEVCDNTNCQVYKGYGGEVEAVNALVDETAGLLAMYGGNPINAVFFASSGGYTEDSENVWLESVPYMRGVPEYYEPDVNKWTRTLTLSDVTALLSQSGASIGQATDILISAIDPSGRIQKLTIVGTNGSKELEKEAIRTFFAGKGGTLPSRMFSINGRGAVFQSTTAASKPERTANEKGGAVVTDPVILAAPTVYVEGIGNIKLVPAQEETIGGDNLIYVVENDVVRAVPSAAFMTNEPEGEDKPAAENEPQKQTGKDDKGNEAEKAQTGTMKPVISGGTGSTVNAQGTFVIEGRGNGHGVGMSQKGANGMAKQGFTYEEILLHYYTGITLEK